MPINLDDKRTVKRLLAGEEGAFDRFFEDHFARLYRFAARRMPDDSAAITEIVHATLSKALRKLDSYRGEAALFSWLCAICRHQVTDWLRQNQRYREHIVLTEDLPDIQAAVDSLQVSTDFSPEREAQRHELARLIQVALDQLPPHYGDALEWKYMQGYSVKEIAERLGLGNEAVQSLLARAKRAFKDVYTTMADPVLPATGPDRSASP